MKLKESQLPEMYSKALFEEVYFDLAPDHTDKMFDVLFTGTSAVLNFTKSKERPAAYAFKALNGTFIAAAIVQYFESTSENPGNWSLVWTFDEADIPDNALVNTLDDSQTHQYFIGVAGNKYAMQFKNESAIMNCLVYCLTHLKKWLDENAKETEEVSIELDGIFKARVAVENGEKVFALEPGEDVKVLIKSDDMIEK